MDLRYLSDRGFKEKMRENECFSSNFRVVYLGRKKSFDYKSNLILKRKGSTIESSW